MKDYTIGFRIAGMYCFHTFRVASEDMAKQYALRFAKLIAANAKVSDMTLEHPGRAYTIQVTSEYRADFTEVTYLDP